MNPSEMLSRQGRCLLQLGIALFLFTSFEGFVIPAFAVPNLGRSVHTLSAYTGVLFVAVGLMWPMLTLGTTSVRIAFWFLIYQLSQQSPHLYLRLFGVPVPQSSQ